MSTPPALPTGRATDLSAWRRGLALLDTRERRMAWVVLGVVILSAISAAVMVGSILPFLTVLSDPSRIDTIPQLAWAYARFGYSSHHQFLVALGLVTIAVIVLTNAMQMLRVYAVARFSMMRIHSISRRLLARYLHQPYEFFLTAHSGDMSSRILNESNQVVQYFLRPAAEVVAAAMTILMVVSVVIWVDPLVSLIAFGVIGGVYLAAFWFSRGRLAQLGLRRAEANKTRFRIAGEALAGIKDIKLLDAEDMFLSRYGTQSETMAKTHVGMMILTQMPMYIVQAVAFSGIILLCLQLLEPGGTTNAGTLASVLPLLGVFGLAAQRLMPELSKLYQSMGQLSYGRAAVDAIYEHLRDDPVVQMSPQDTGPALHFHNELNLTDIRYFYPNAERAGLDGVSFCIRAGERIGIVGPSGAGKTTLADILLGVLVPVAGEIRVDGSLVTADRLPAWRRMVGYVPQEIYLLDASVAENIAFGVAPDKIDRARVEVVARLAQLDVFIRNELPQGYDTPVGERGLRLSGGQRQRIGIARALYRDAGLIVFDEATSALDNVTEQDLMVAIDALPGDKTVVMIAHRLSTVRRCDRILVLEGGRVAGFDSWDRLIAENPVFQALAKLESAG